jgi:hypothetical protein
MFPRESRATAADAPGNTRSRSARKRATSVCTLPVSRFAPRLPPEDRSRDNPGKLTERLYIRRSPSPCTDVPGSRGANNA